jgi:hypothetical protein
MDGQHDDNLGTLDDAITVQVEHAKQPRCFFVTNMAPDAKFVAGIGDLWT